MAICQHELIDQQAFGMGKEWVGMAERPKPVGSEPTQRVYYPMGLIQLGSVYIGSGLGLSCEMSVGYRVSSGPKSAISSPVLLRLKATIIHQQLEPQPPPSYFYLASL